MRNLIRPTLFIVARLGLFLAMAAWHSYDQIASPRFPWRCNYRVSEPTQFQIRPMGIDLIKSQCGI